MTYQESFTTQYEDILVYEQPQPQQSPRDKAWDPHPELNPLQAPSVQTSIWEDEHGNLDGEEDTRLVLFIASSSIIILSLITIIGVVSCFILCSDEPEFSEMVVAAANLVTKHGIDNIDLDNDYIGSDHNFLHDGTSRRKRRHDDDIISMGHDDADAEGMLKNAYEESISEESSIDEEEENRQVKMATSAVALQLTARNSADLGRRLSERTINQSLQRDIYRMQPNHHHHDSSTSTFHPNEDIEAKYALRNEKKYAKDISTSTDCDMTKVKTSAKEVLYKNAIDSLANINRKSSGKYCDVTKESIMPLGPTSFMYQNNHQIYMDTKNRIQMDDQSYQMCNSRSNSYRRYVNRDPPPRPPRQKPTNIPLFPLDLSNVQGTVFQPTYRFDDGNCNNFEKDEEIRYKPKITSNSVMSPLSSCPNIYGKVMKKQSTFVQTPTEDVSQSISLIASKVHLFESQSEKELSNSRKKNHLNDIMTPCILKPMVSALAQNQNKCYKSDEKNVHKENNDTKCNSTLNTFQTSVGIEPTPSNSSIQKAQSNHKKKADVDINDGNMPLNRDQTSKPKPQNSFHSIDRNRHHIHSPKKIANHQRHQSTKSQEDKKKQNSNLLSPSPSSSINSVFYKKCKLCDKCSQKFGHSNKAVGTRGETTLI